MLFEKKIQFRFKGTRNYVHGTDLFDAILSMAMVFFKEYPSRIKGTFHRLLASDAILRIYNEGEELDHADPYAAFSIELKSHSYTASITNANSHITSSYEYDEKIVLEKMVMEKDTAKMLATSAFTYIEQIVAMTKELHLTLYPDMVEKWLFTRIDIKDVLDPSLYPGRELVIKALKNFHNRLTQNAVFLDDHMLGHIWFSKAF